MAFRIKFKITESTDYFFSPATKRIVLTPVADPDTPLKDRFASASVGAASLTVFCDNPAALSALTLGREFYFDITPARN